MHVALPKELESIIHDRVDSGIYSSASEVISAALRHFFHLSEEEAISSEAAEQIRKLVEPRLAVMEDETSVLMDVEDAFAKIDNKYFR